MFITYITENCRPFKSVIMFVGRRPFLSLFRPGYVKRYLSIHEHQSMSLLKEYDIPVPQAKLATSPEEAYRAAQSFGTYKLRLPTELSRN